MIRTILLSLLFVPCAAFANGQGVGSGGDALRELFDRARVAAGAHVDSLQWCSFDQTAPKKIVDLVLEKRRDIKMDIATSPHLWVVDTQTTCAFTQHKSKASIYLSYPTCASTVGTNLDLAMFTVLHETAHHLGIADEGEADLFARLIMDAEPVANCPNRSNDIWDKNYCSGRTFDVNDARKFLTPGKTEAQVAELKLEVRGRTCTQISGCGSWSAIDTATGINIGHVAGSYYYPANYGSPYLQVRSAPTAEGLYAWDVFHTTRIGSGDSALRLVRGDAKGGVFGDSYEYYIQGERVSVKEAKLTESCAWLKGSKSTSINSHTGQYYELEWLHYANF